MVTLFIKIVPLLGVIAHTCDTSTQEIYCKSEAGTIYVRSWGSRLYSETPSQKDKNTTLMEPGSDTNSRLGSRLGSSVMFQAGSALAAQL